MSSNTNIKALFESSVQAFIQENKSADIRELALKAQGKFSLPLGFLLNQINGRQKAKKKLPLWFANENIVFPVDLSMQQCSSELSAYLKTKDLPKGKLCVDLGGGFGIDTYFLAKKFDRVIYVEQDKELCEIVAHNCQVLGATNIEVIHATSDNFIDSFTQKADLIFLDPARRDDQQNRIFQFEDCSPNIVELTAVLKEKATHLLVKASPIIAIDLAFEQFTAFKGVQVVGINNECKEVLFHTYPNLPAVRCSHSGLGDLEELVFGNTREVIPVFSVFESYIYEPNVTVRKAQKQDELAQQFGLKKLFQKGSLFTSAELKKDFPGRVFKVERELSSKKEIQKLKNAEVIAKNFPVKALDLKKKYKLGASSSQFVFAFTDFSDKKVMLYCSRV